MKESERLRKLSNSTENDMKAWTYHWKSERAKREEFFLEILPKIRKYVHVIQNKNKSYRFFIQNVGRVDFYPKSNKALITRKNKWIRNGLEFIVKKLNINLD